MTTLLWATEFLRRGISTIPVNQHDKRPDFNLLPRGDDGDPTWDPYKSLLPTMENFRSWFKNPDRNYAVILGWQNLAVLDFDDVEQYTTWSLWCHRQGGLALVVAQSAFQVRTSRGVHVYFRLYTGVRNRKIGGIDFKSQGYVVGPGSVHPSGAIYTPLLSQLNFPLISALSDILPAELLQSYTQLPAHVAVPQPAVFTSPWQAANFPPAALGNGVIDRIKKQYRIEDLFLDKQKTSSDGRWWLVCCPLHDDHHPSMWIDTQQQICGCFSGCTDKPMDVIGLYARLHGLHNSEAIRLMAGDVV